MAFYICVNGKFSQVDLPDIQESVRLEKTRIPGLLYERPILKNKKNYVLDIMSTKILYLHAHDNFLKAKKSMHTYKIHHLPVIDQNEKLVGIVSNTNILKLDHEFLADLTPVHKFMNKTILCCDVDTDINAVARAFWKEHISCLPIIDHQRKIMGIVTINDLLRWVAENRYDHN